MQREQDLSLFVNSLTTIDCSYLDPDSGVLGETWIVDLVLEGIKNEEAMLMEFGAVKSELKKAIDDFVDHRFLVPTLLEGLEKTDQGIVYLNAKGERFRYEAPAQAFFFLEELAIRKEAVVKAIEAHLKTLMPENITDIKLTLRREGEAIDAVNESFLSSKDLYYQYSHGLKQHLGNCQRLVHGHRSVTRVFKEGLRDQELEKTLRDRLQGRYMFNSDNLIRRFSEEGVDYIELGYSALQGEFKLQIPVHYAYELREEPTVENIAQDAARVLAREYPGKKITVQAFEGIDKGAISSYHCD